MIYTVYSITCLNNNKIYFGRSQEIEKRWRAHRNMLRTSTHNNINMQKDWNEYGEDNFLFEILHETDSLEKSVEIEQSYIDSEKHLKYNIANATMGGDTFTNNPRKEQIRELKSINSSGKNNPMYGIPKSELMIKRVKEANSKPIFIGNMFYSSITEASRATGIKKTTISYRLNSNSSKFLEWRYA